MGASGEFFPGKWISQFFKFFPQKETHNTMNFFNSIKSKKSESTEQKIRCVESENQLISTYYNVLSKIQSGFK